MQTHVLVSTDDWLLVSTASICRIQVLNSWHPGMLRVFVGAAPPSDTDPFFEVVQGENWIKTTTVDNVYVYAPHATIKEPLTITVSDKVDGASGGGGGGSTGGLTDVQLRANPIETTAPTTVDKLDELKLQLAAQIMQTDDLETLLTTLIAALPATLGKKTAANSLSVTLDSDSTLVDAVEALTKPTDTQLVRHEMSVYTPSFTKPTGTGTISGTSRATVFNIGAANGTLLGTVLDVNESVEFDALGVGTIGDIAYDSTGTKFAIVTLTKV